MRFPNKVLSYEESTIGKLATLLAVIQTRDISPFELYRETKASFEDLSEYIEVLLCLYALRRIEYNTHTGGGSICCTK